MITGIHHISMKCGTEEELEKARDFYLHVLGFSLVREWPEGIMIDSGRGLIEIFSNGTGIRSKGAIRHVAFATDDVDEIVKKVKAAGYEVFIEPKDLVIRSEPAYHARMAFCFGPLGEEIEFFQEQAPEEDPVLPLYESRFLNCYDLRYAPGKHYYEASRRKKKDLVVKMTDEEARKMLPDAVTIAVVLHLPGNETRLLMSYEYRYPIGQFLLSPVAGLLDPEDRECPDPLVTAAVREIREETGLTVKESDRVYVLNPCAFSTPGMTDESNAFLCAEITLDNLDDLNQNGAEGSELFNGFELLDRERAKEIFRTGRDEHGTFYSLAAWTVLSIFLSLF